MEYIASTVRKLEKKGHFKDEKRFIQHGRISVEEHSINVARLSLKLSTALHLNVDKKTLIRGALLHDYFLYDWHNKEKWHRFHGFRHPFFAMKNAIRDYRITKKEANIIRSHMFPLIPLPPTSKEGWIVCIADKISALHETLFKRKVTTIV